MVTKGHKYLNRPAFFSWRNVLSTYDLFLLPDIKGLKYLSCRSSPPEMFLGKGVLKICGKFTGEHPCRSVISIKLHCNSIEIAFWYEYSPVNLLHSFRTHFLKIWRAASSLDWHNKTIRQEITKFAKGRDNIPLEILFWDFIYLCRTPIFRNSVDYSKYNM